MAKWNLAMKVLEKHLLCGMLYVPNNTVANDCKVMFSLKWCPKHSDSSLFCWCSRFLRSYDDSVGPFCSAKWSDISFSARYRWEIVFFTALGSSAYVSSKPSGWKQGSQPKSRGPRGSTICPRVLPLNSCTGSSILPLLYAKVHSAYADLSSNPASSLCRPSGFIFSRNHFM